MQKRIFISYRRSDTQMTAGRLRDALVRQFGLASVFRDKEAIRPGYDWLKEVQSVLAEDVVVLALIGPGWADLRDLQGRRRLDDPQDSNRLELETALNKGVPLIPVLVEGADVPRADSLPSTLASLTRRNSVRLRDDDWDSDIARLMEALRQQGVPQLDGSTGSQGRKASPGAMIWLIAVAVVAAMLIVGAWWVSSIDAGDHTSGPVTESSVRGDPLLGSWEQWVIEENGNLSPRGTFIVSRSEGHYVMSAQIQREDATMTVGISDVNYDDRSQSWTFRSNWGGGRLAVFTLKRASDNVFEGVSSLDGTVIQRERWIRKSGS